jgi:hypothetical protein
MRSPTKAQDLKEIFQDHSFILKQYAMWSAEDMVQKEKEKSLV